ncbi:hypothetical protein ACJZ2D_005507 [Fusarium nematophilum]
MQPLSLESPEQLQSLLAGLSWTEGSQWLSDPQGALNPSSPNGQVSGQETASLSVPRVPQLHPQHPEISAKHQSGTGLRPTSTNLSTGVAAFCLATKISFSFFLPAGSTTAASMAPVAGEGVPLLYVTIVMLALCWVTVIARIGTRKWIKNIGLDDYLMCGGLILYTVTGCLVIVCCFHGAGQKSAGLKPADIMKGTKLFFVAQFFYSACTVPIKTSICVALLRIADSRRRFAWTIWAVIMMTSIAAVVFIIATANVCHPITTLWGETTTGTCNTKLNSSIGFFFSAVSIVTDWTMAILPGVLLWNVQMKTKVKLPVIVMLSLGVFASSATIVRLRFLTLYNNPQEFMYSTGAIGLWSILEEGIGITAGSMPALRPLLNLPIFGRSTYASNTGSGNASSHMKPLKVGYGQRDRTRRSDDDGDSQKHILKQTQVTVTEEHAAASNDWARQHVYDWEGNK